MARATFRRVVRLGSALERVRNGDTATRRHVSQQVRQVAQNKSTSVDVRHDLVLWVSSRNTQVWMVVVEGSCEDVSSAMVQSTASVDENSK